MKDKILIIEDEKKIADILATYLQKGGFEVTIARTGQNGLDLFKNQFDLIVLDLMLPDIDGEQLCQSIRKISNVPIVMLTAKSAEDDKIKGLGLGADDYIIKPFSLREVEARIKAHIRRTQTTKKKILSFNQGNLIIDITNSEVKKKNIFVYLTATEFKLLLTLAEKPNIIFSREQLLSVTQGYNFDGYDRVIDAHIKNIRQKIEDNPNNPVFIKTIYGSGYKFIGIIDVKNIGQF